MGFIARILLFLGGIIASWFVSTEVTNFIAYQIAFTLLLIAVLAAMLAFLPWWLQKRKKTNKSD
ncbi:hypothetical protein [Rheinheimera oceanensis]|jgi:uncharacterized membrane protein YidH (DUF202 family)|uniref:hypothetical protein n=1 Tax=Rheinheimera oceanensis TaxID=2817449 RepID=UPI001BFD180E|nr:hypothetical protein [Rheinheimera oceanensis]